MSFKLSLYEKPNLLFDEVAMLPTKKLILANILLGSIVHATVGTATLAYALTDPDCRQKLKDCSDRICNCKDKKFNGSFGGDRAEQA